MNAPVEHPFIRIERALLLTVRLGRALAAVWV